MSLVLTLNLLAGAILLSHSLCVLNRMNRHSNHLYRLFYVLMGVGALAVLMAPLYGCMQPAPGEALLKVGMTGVVVIGWFIKNRRAIP